MRKGLHILSFINGIVIGIYFNKLVSDSNCLMPKQQELAGIMGTKKQSAAGTTSYNNWKLWHDMTKQEQDESLQRIKPIVEKYGKLIQRHKSKKHGQCELVMFGNGGEHQLCGPPPELPCFFVSFGINDDPSFDRALADQWQCRGFAGDPTVSHPSKIHPLVTFHNIGATMLSPNEERLIDKGGTAEWWETSMPGLRKFLGLDYINFVKMDCEGCEVALARDILLEDREYLRKVGQISIETHVTKTWINSTEEFYYFGLHFALLEEAGFQLEWSSVFGCSKRHEVAGCVPEFEQTGFPCGYDPWPGKPNVVFGRSCHDFLWKRY